MAASNYQFNWPAMSPDFKIWWDKVVDYRLRVLEEKKHHHHHEDEHKHTHVPRFTTINGNEYVFHRHTMRSKYMPHQGKQEIARRLEQQKHNLLKAIFKPQ